MPVAASSIKMQSGRSPGPVNVEIAGEFLLNVGFIITVWYRVRVHLMDPEEVVAFTALNSNYSPSSRRRGAQAADELLRAPPK
jgi:hypothetical protein